jgi:hypothetical protein
MLREMARSTNQLAGKVKSEPQPPVAEIEIELFGVFRLDPFVATVG